MRPRILTYAAAAVALAGGTLAAPAHATAQTIAYQADLPRAMVFIQEEGRGKIAAREMSSFLREAGFDVIDPALAIDQAAQNLTATLELVWEAQNT